MGDPYRILVIGNNAAKSSQLFDKLQLSYPINSSTQVKRAQLEFHAYPDLDPFNRFPKPQIDDTIGNLFEDDSAHGGVSLFIILINQTGMFNRDFEYMLANIPKNRKILNEEYFWNHATILFSFEDNMENYSMEVLKCMDRNESIKRVVERAGNRYIWMSNSDTKNEIEVKILSQCKEVKKNKVKKNKVIKKLGSWVLKCCVYSICCCCLCCYVVLQLLGEG